MGTIWRFFIIAVVAVVINLGPGTQLWAVSVHHRDAGSDNSLMIPESSTIKRPPGSEDIDTGADEPEGQEPEGGHKNAKEFVIATKLGNWAQCRQICGKMKEGGDLAVVHNAEENKALETMCRNAGHTHCYLGACARDDGSWTWLDGTVFGSGFNFNSSGYFDSIEDHYTDWILYAPSAMMYNQPDRTDQRCLIILPGEPNPHQGCWDNFWCEISAACLCAV